jgi:glycine cleavage system H protein
LFCLSAAVSSYRFAKSHEWAKLDGDIATIGISVHAQKELGDIVFVELPEKGDILEAGKTIAAVESVKAAADVYTPLAGEVIFFDNHTR